MCPNCLLPGKSRGTKGKKRHEKPFLMAMFISQHSTEQHKKIRTGGVAGSSPLRAPSGKRFWSLVSGSVCYYRKLMGSYTALKILLQNPLPSFFMGKFLFDI